MDSPINVTTCPAGTTDEYHIDVTTRRTWSGHVVWQPTRKRGTNSLSDHVDLCINCLNFSTLPFTITGSWRKASLGGRGKMLARAELLPFNGRELLSCRL